MAVASSVAATAKLAVTATFARHLVLRAPGVAEAAVPVGEPAPASLVPRLPMRADWANPN